MIAWAAPAFAGAWTKELGEVYAKASGDLYATGHYVSPEAETGGGYVGQQYGAYAEVGVLPGWRGQVTASLPFVVGTHHAVYADPFGEEQLRATTARLGDLRVGAQVALHRRWPLALAVDAKVPTYANGRVGQVYPRYQDLFPKPGDGQVDLAATLLAGASPWSGGFAELGVGYLHRTEWFRGWETDIALADGARFLAKVGHRSGPVLGLVGAEGVWSPDPTPWTRSAVGLWASAMVDVAEGVALEPRVYGEPWVENASRGAGGGLGVSVRR